MIRQRVAGVFRRAGPPSIVPRHRPLRKFIDHALDDIAMRCIGRRSNAEQHREHTGDPAVGCDDDIAGKVGMPVAHPHQQIGVALTIRRGEIPFVAFAGRQHGTIARRGPRGRSTPPSGRTRVRPGGDPWHSPPAGARGCRARSPWFPGRATSGLAT